jgi:hypothetical protein
VLVLDIAIAHQYLFVQNEIDRATTLSIADRLRSDPDYRPDLPLAIVGQLPQDVANPLARSFPFVREGQIWGYVTQYSAYATAWSRERLLGPFLSFTYPTEADIRIANEYALSASCWPAPSSARVVHDVMVVVLERTDKTGRSCRSGGAGTVSLSSVAPAFLAGAPTADVRTCSLDQIDGATWGAEAVSVPGVDLVRVLGWGADVERRLVPDAIYVRLRDGSGIDHYAAAGIIERPDVAETFHDPGLLHSGFTATFSVAGLEPGQYQAAIVMDVGDRALVCDPGRSMRVQ